MLTDGRRCELEQPRALGIVCARIRLGDGDERGDRAPDLVREDGEPSCVDAHPARSAIRVDRPGGRVGEHRVVALHPGLGERRDPPSAPVFPSA